MFSRIRRPNKNQDLFRRNERMMRLDVADKPRCFSISKQIYDAVETRDIRDLKGEINYDGQINEDNYFEPLKMLLRTEEAHQVVEMRKYDKVGYEILELWPEMDEEQIWEGMDLKPYYAVELRGQADNGLLDISDQVLLQVMGEPNGRVMRIKEFKEDYVILKVENSDKETDIPFRDKFVGKLVNVYFVSAGVGNRACEVALEDHQRSMARRRVIFENIDHGHNGIGDRLDNINDGLNDIDNELDNINDGLADIDDEPKIALRENGCDLIPAQEDTRLKQLNLEQRQAVIGILAAKCRPKPYILFGPPGTGKTHTLVEAVVQIFLRSPNLRVLFCANSNTCVDQTYDKLKATGVFTDRQLIRLKPGKFMDEKPRVVVTTNIKSASLRSNFFYFDYVIIDEAGHAHEAESLVPCCSLNSDGCLVLAGDPKQLGPVVQFGQAGRDGLESSMLERIIQWNIYKRDPETKKYDSKYLTKLIDCYRCDPRILAISNKLFYDDELRCLHDTPRSLLKIMGLKTPVQVLFCKGGLENQPRNSTSWENRAEITECVSIATRLYKIGFTADQIGIMSPYARQAREMRKQLRESLRSGIGSLLDQRFLIKEKKVTTEPKDQRARDAARRNEELKTRADWNPAMLEHVEMIEKVEWKKIDQNWICKIDTVDSFQGNEREVVIFSPVRTSTEKDHRFLDHAKRFNVAMSRAKWLLIVVGNEDVLGRSEFWNEFLCNAKQDIKNWPRHSKLDSPHSQGRPLFRD